CLERCVQDHEICRDFASSSVLPTRVVHLGLNNSEIKLFEPPSGTIAQFAALSYCWGKQLPITTTGNTIAERKLGLAWNSLPPVFQDAVTVARRLGLEYIWIDSLCIIQDSHEDWEIESMRMASIYQSAHVTIAVASSDSCTVPFLTPRLKDGPAHPITLEVDSHDGNSYCLKAREPARPHHTSDDPLNTRAWVHQERILSTRILHYTTHELVWECRRSMMCECQAHEYPPAREPLLPEEASSEQGDDKGRGIAFYTERKVTYPSDRLPALSGIASIVHQRTGSSYMAGLWRDNLISDLQWEVSDNDHPTKRSLDVYRAPTFSWASLEVRAKYPYHFNAPSFRHDATVLNAGCSAAGLDPFGTVKDGFVELEGYVFHQQI
ncbi:HET-domain-containing protein, partial [Glonium stellatum]